MHIRNNHVGINFQLGLGDTVSGCQIELSEHTLNIWRVLLKSCFHPAIVSLSTFAWSSRDAAFRLPILIILFWMVPTVLRLRPR